MFFNVFYVFYVIWYFLCYLRSFRFFMSMLTIRYISFTTSLHQAYVLNMTMYQHDRPEAPCTSTRLFIRTGLHAANVRIFRFNNRTLPWRPYISFFSFFQCSCLHNFPSSATESSCLHYFPSSAKESSRLHNFPASATESSRLHNLPSSATENSRVHEWIVPRELYLYSYRNQK